MYDRFPFSENIIHLKDQFFLAPFPTGDYFPKEVLQDLISVQREDSAITPSTNWRNTFLVDMPKHHRDNVYHTWTIGVFSDDKILQKIVGTVDIQFTDLNLQPRTIPHVGYWVSNKYRGKGLATSALKHMMKLYKQVVYGALVEQENTASQRVLYKCGFREISYDEISEYYYYECKFRS